MASTLVRQSKMEGTYTFASQPRALQPQRKKYRDDTNGSADGTENQIFYGNIMYDRRVIRGNTYSQHALLPSAFVDPVEVQKQKEKSRREIAKKRARRAICIESPGPVEGRKHVEMQTELYLEELSDQVEETEAECQTDAFLDRPPSPLFIPNKSGIDKETQILDGELFDFNVEVLPVLEVLIGKTMEEALLEVMEEEELANIREQQHSHEEVRNSELVEQQRLEEKERRHCEEKELRIQQHLEMARIEKETAARIAAHAFAQSYLADLVPSVFGTLTENGYFYDTVEREVEKIFMPWVLDCLDEQMTAIMRSHKLLDGLIQEIVAERQEQLHQLEENDAKMSEHFETNHFVELPEVAIEEYPVSMVAEANRFEDVQSESQEISNEVNPEADNAADEEEHEE